MSTDALVLKGYIEASSFKHFTLSQPTPIKIIQKRVETSNSPAPKLVIDEKGVAPEFAVYRKKLLSVPFSDQCFVSTFLSEEKNKTTGTYFFENGTEVPAIQDIRTGTYKIICNGEAQQRVLNITRETLYSLTTPSKEMQFCGGTKLATLETVRDEEGRVIQSYIQQIISAPTLE